MVKGLALFRAWFADYRDQYVLIGGTAAGLAMEEAGLEFRATRDLDVVLHVEALTPAFGETFWAFIGAGGYQVRQASDAGKPAFYRFQKPTDERFPAMVELFARAPDALRPIEHGQLTPIPFDEAISSLSAILLDDEYYAFHDCLPPALAYPCKGELRTTCASSSRPRRPMQRSIRKPWASDGQAWSKCLRGSPRPTDWKEDHHEPSAIKDISIACKSPLGT